MKNSDYTFYFGHVKIDGFVLQDILCLFSNVKCPSCDVPLQFEVIESTNLAMIEFDLVPPFL